MHHARPAPSAQVSSSSGVRPGESPGLSIPEGATCKDVLRLEGEMQTYRARLHWENLPCNTQGRSVERFKGKALKSPTTAPSLCRSSEKATTERCLKTSFSSPFSCSQNHHITIPASLGKVSTKCPALRAGHCRCRRLEHLRQHHHHRPQPRQWPPRQHRQQCRTRASPASSEKCDATDSSPVLNAYALASSVSRSPGSRTRRVSGAVHLKTPNLPNGHGPWSPQISPLRALRKDNMTELGQKSGEASLSRGLLLSGVKQWFLDSMFAEPKHTHERLSYFRS